MHLAQITYNGTLLLEEQVAPERKLSPVWLPKTVSQPGVRDRSGGRSEGLEGLQTQSALDSFAGLLAFALLPASLDVSTLGSGAEAKGRAKIG